jgi:hypothetical protein
MGERVSERCEFGPNKCVEPSDWAYPAMGGGWFALCQDHAEKHLGYCAPVAAIRAGTVTMVEFMAQQRPEGA